MCESVAHGGQRCAAHTGPRLAKAVSGTAEWDEAAADHAATPTGREELEASLASAALAGDVDLEAALLSALRVGTSRREAYQTTRQILRDRRESLRQEGSKGDDFWAAEVLDCIYSADQIIDRGEAVFCDEDNTVEIAAARQHVIDLDTAADGLTDTFKGFHPEIPWQALAKTRDRFPHRYDNVNRAIVWNTLVEDLPVIRATVRAHLGL